MKDNPHVNHRSRIRKRFREKGLGAFADHEVLELLLYYCYPRRDTNEIAHRMINAFGSLHNLMDANVKDIMSRCKVSENVAVLINLIPSLAGLYFKNKGNQRTLFDNERDAGSFMISLFINSTVEHFYIVCLDAKRQVNHVALISEGTINEAAVYPRKIVEEALRHQATAVILTHNHPGGLLQPSQKDLEVTRVVVEGLNFIGITVVDHIIVADEKYYSFASRRQHVAGYE